MLKYQRTYKVNSGAWYGNETYEKPYTDFKSFGGGNGTDGIYGSKVRAFYDIDGNGTYTQGEPVSDWSNECYITYDHTAPEAPTNWRTRFTHNSDTASGKYQFTFTESVSDDIGSYEYQFNSYDLESGAHYNGETDINPSGCNIEDTNTEETCTWTVTAQQKRVWIYRVRSVDKAGNTSEWTNWDNIPTNDGDPTTTDFDEISLSDMKYSDWKNGTGVFDSATYDYDYDNGGYIIREDKGPETIITAPDTSTVHYVNSPITIEYDTISEDWTETKKVELWYSYEGFSYKLDSENYNSNGNIDFNFGDGNGTYCFYTLGEDVADDGAQDNNTGNRESVPSPECELEVVYDESVPTIDEIEDKVYSEGEVVNLGFLDGLEMRDAGGNLDKLYLEINYIDPQGNPYKISDNIPNIDDGLNIGMAGCGFDGCGYGGTTNQLAEYLTGSTVNFADYDIPIDTSVFPEGEYTLEYYVTDTVSNKSDTHIVNITINNVAPVVSLAEDSTISEGETVNFDGSFIDPSTVYMTMVIGMMMEIGR